MRPYAFGTFALVTVLSFVGAGYADKTRLHWVADEATHAPPQAVPDRVVGVERHCESRDVGDTNLFASYHPIAVGLCDVLWDQIGELPRLASGAPPVWHFLEIIVRTQAGTIYRIEVAATTKVAVGDEWPPK
ncbi:MAG: hypothetical protein C0506_02035 [Anaerolinea sp.]|nr:hypothetical protein [Anaerolinea sp.]